VASGAQLDLQCDTAQGWYSSTNPSATCTPGTPLALNTPCTLGCSTAPLTNSSLGLFLPSNLTSFVASGAQLDLQCDTAQGWYSSTNPSATCTPGTPLAPNATCALGCLTAPLRRPGMGLALPSDLPVFVSPGTQTNLTCDTAKGWYSNIDQYAICLPGTALTPSTPCVLGCSSAPLFNETLGVNTTNLPESYPPGAYVGVECIEGWTSCNTVVNCLPPEPIYQPQLCTQIITAPSLTFNSQTGGVVVLGEGVSTCGKYNTWANDSRQAVTWILEPEDRSSIYFRTITVRACGGDPWDSQLTIYKVTNHTSFCASTLEEVTLANVTNTFIRQDDECNNYPPVSDNPTTVTFTAEHNVTYAIMLSGTNSSTCGAANLVVTGTSLHADNFPSAAGMIPPRPPQPSEPAGPPLKKK